MKKTHRIALLVSIAALVAVLLWLWPRNRPHAVPSSASTPSSTAQPTPAEMRSAEMSASKSANAPVEISAPQQPTSKRERKLELLSTANHQPIEFYGKVVDQFGNPLADVAVYASVIYNTGSKSGIDKDETKTDAQGLFSLRGLRGRTLGIGLEKAGYEDVGDHGPFQYTQLVKEEERHVPDAKKPVLFTLWKLHGAEPMIHGEKDFKIAPNGEPVRVDLMTGKIVKEGGDLVISMHHMQVPHGTVYAHFDWSAEVAIVEGGFIEESRRRITGMYEAPESGYQPTLTLHFVAGTKDWVPSVAKNLYVKSRGNTYSRIYLDLQTSPAQPASFVGLQWWLNPKPGSRNLEFDSSKLATAPTSKP